jgi:DNA (cytosine-5)-methyltransferase 3A
MNCIGLALSEIGADFQIYASEIDKHANKVSDCLFPDTVNLGDVVFVRRVLCWKQATIDKALCSDFLSKATKAQFRRLLFLRDIQFDLVVGGSPCQGFSFAGKQLNFEDPRSKLFFDFVKIVEACKVKNKNLKFLLENVRMKKQYQRIITKMMGIAPITINSALLSAQSRARIYWTNIGTTKANLLGIEEPGIPQPKDRGILLEDVLESEVEEKYYLSAKMVQHVTDSTRLKKKYTAVDGNKALALTARNYAAWNGTFVTGAHQTDRKFINGKRADNANIPTAQQIEARVDGKSNCLTTVQKDSLAIIQRMRGLNAGEVFFGKSPSMTSNSWQHNNHVIQINPSKESNGKQPYQHNRIYSDKGKAPTLNTRGQGSWIAEDVVIRRLTVKECCRLQTVPEWAIDKMLNCGVSDYQLYRMLGNGWTVVVIAYILNHLQK